MNIGNSTSPFTFLDNTIKSLTVKNDIYSLDTKRISKNDIDLDYDIKHYGEQNEEHIGIVQIKVIVTKKSQNQLFKCNLVLEGGFSAGTQDIDEEKFINLLRHNGTASLYSIARSIIIDISSKCMLSGQIRIPMLNVVSFVEAKNKLPPKHAAKERK